MAGSLHCSALPISECLLWRRAAAEKAAYREAKAKALEDELEQIALTAERKDAALAAREAAIEKKRIRDKKIRDEEVRLKMIEHEKELVEKAKEEEAKILARLAEMEVKEKIRQEKLAVEAAQRAEIAERKREAAELRLKQQQEKSAELEQQRIAEADKRTADLLQRQKLRAEAEAEALRLRRIEQKEKAAEQEAVRLKMLADAEARVQELMKQQEDDEARQLALHEQRKKEAAEKKAIQEMAAQEKLDYIERKRRIVAYHTAVEKKKIADNELAEQEKAEQAKQRRHRNQVKRKDEKTKMDILKERMEMMKITKKYEIPEGFESAPTPTEDEPEAVAERTPMPPLAARSCKARPHKKGKKKPHSAGGDLDQDVVNVYSHWGDEMRRHQAMMILKARPKGKKGKKGKHPKAASYFTASAPASEAGSEAGGRER